MNHIVETNEMIENISMCLTLPGIPISQGRPRLGRGKVYDPMKTEKIKMKLLLKSQMNARGFKMLSGEFVDVNLIFFMPIPTSLSMVKQKALVNEFHASKPDIDNLIKFVLDCMNEICFTDDKKIVRITAQKRYSDISRTEICVIALDQKDRES